MRIAAVTHYYIEENRAGGEMMLHGILSHLAKEHTVDAYITDNFLADKVIDGVNVHYNFKRDYSFEYDLIITQFDNSKFTIRDARKKNKPVMIIAHNDALETQNLINRLTSKDFVVFNTNWLKECTPTNAKSVVVHPPINMKPIKSIGDKITIVNLTVEKGIFVFLRLANHLPYNFMAVKGGYWKNKQRTINLPNVEVVENTPDMRSIYEQTKIILMPSSYESFGMVAAEAAKCGIPVICTPTKGLVENLGEAGIYKDRSDTKGYMEEINKLMTDEKYYKSCSDAIRKRVIDTDKELRNLSRLING